MPKKYFYFSLFTVTETLFVFPFMWVISWLMLVTIWNISSCLVWFGVIFIRHGLYQDGVFKFTVYIPDNYPDGECPVSSCQMNSKILFQTVVLQIFKLFQLSSDCFWTTFLCFVLEISIRHSCFPSSCWPCVWRAWCEKDFHQMEVWTERQMRRL